VRGLHALPPKLLKKLLPLKAKNHHALWSFGGCVLSIKKKLTFYNINTLNFARVFNLVTLPVNSQEKFPLIFFGIKHYLISLRRILKIAMGNMMRQKTVR
jgi:hypothetical protein